MTRLRKKKLSSFERLKMSELDELEKLFINPLTTSVHSANTEYHYSVEDVVNYFRNKKRKFTIIL